MKLCIAGKNDITVNVIKLILEKGYVAKQDLLVLPCDSVKEYDTWQKSVKKYSREEGISIVVLEDLYAIDDLVFFCVQYDRIIKPNLFASERLFNTHFAPLPKYRGSYTSIVPILNGDSQSGVTIHEIEFGIDTGPIIDQVLFKIDIQDTMRDLYFKYMKNGLLLIERNIERIIRGEYTAKPQSVIGASIVYQKDMSYTFHGIDLRKTSFEIHNSIRAYIFEEFQLPIIKKCRIYKSVLTDEKMKPCTIEKRPDRFLISGHDGYIVEAFIR